jgi:hypothetical protein
VPKIMKTSSIRLASLLALFVLCTGSWTSAAFAQGRQAGRGGPAGRLGRQGGAPGEMPAGGSSPAELQDLMDAMVLVQAQRDLNLSNDQFPQFLTRLKGLQAVRRRAENQRNRAVMELRRLMQAANAGDGAGPADETQIRDRLKALDDAEAQGLVAIRQARVTLEQILNPRQQARFRLLEEQIERRKLELFARSRQVAPSSPPAPPPK